jgi:hypothetical protein
VIYLLRHFHCVNNILSNEGKEISLEINVILNTCNIDRVIYTDHERVINSFDSLDELKGMPAIKISSSIESCIQAMKGLNNVLFISQQPILFELASELFNSDYLITDFRMGKLIRLHSYD